MTKRKRTDDDEVFRPGLVDEASAILRAVDVALDEVAADGRLSTDAICLALSHEIARCIARGLVTRTWTPAEADAEIDAVAQTIRDLVACEILFRASAPTV